MVSDISKKKKKKYSFFHQPLRYEIFLLFWHSERLTFGRKIASDGSIFINLFSFRFLR